MVGQIFNIQRFAMHDGPGIRTVVFLHGCPLHCPWCHNPESRAYVKTVSGGMQFRAVSPEELLAEMLRDVLFFDESGGGVTFSGGEPLSQAAFLSKILDLCRERRIHSAVDTCGLGGADAVGVLTKADLILFDVKGLDDASLLAETGASLSAVTGTLEALAAREKRIWLRLPLIPGYGLMNDGPDRLSDWLGVRASWFERVSLLPFHHTARKKYENLGWDDVFQGVSSLEDEQLIPFLEKLSQIHPHVHIGG